MTLVNCNDVENDVRKITSGKMADVVLNNLGSKFWESSISVMGARGRLITLSDVTGGEVKLDLRRFYLMHQVIIGIYRENRKDLLELINLCKDCRTKVWKSFELSEGAEAIKSLNSIGRDGRIIITE
ncbi:MAG: zinc-binding dehydrogenase [Conexivisphaerales archaeon]